MTDDLKLVEQVFDLALAGNDTDIAARKDALWTVGVTLISDVLLRADPLEQEKLLRGLELELRRALNLGLPPPIPRGTMRDIYQAVPSGRCFMRLMLINSFWFRLTNSRLRLRPERRLTKTLISER